MPWKRISGIDPNYGGKDFSMVREQVGDLFQRNLTSYRSDGFNHYYCSAKWGRHHPKPMPWYTKLKVKLWIRPGNWLRCKRNPEKYYLFGEKSFELIPTLRDIEWSWSFKPR